MVGVVDGPSGPHGVLGAEAGAVGDAEVVGEGRQGRAVGGDVVDDEDQDVRVVGQAQQGRFDREAVLDVEGRGRGLRDPVGEPVLADGFDGEREVDVVRTGDVLDRTAVVLGEDGAQGGVPYDDVAERRTQGLRVERPVQAHDEGDVVRGGRALQPVEEPEPLLGVGQGERGRAFLRDERGTGGPVRVRERDGECRDRGVLEEGADLGLGAQGRADPACQPGGGEEWPPSAKKLSSTPTRATPSTSANSPARISSYALRGSRCRAAEGAVVGAGRAARSSFPLGVSGSASSGCTAAGTM